MYARGNRNHHQLTLEEYMPDDKPKDEGVKDDPTTTSNNMRPMATWDFRRAEIEWAQLMQKAGFDYQKRAATAFAEYQQALQQISQDAWSEELAALESVKTELGASGVASEHGATSVRGWNERIAEIRQIANRRARGAARKLSEDRQRLWFDTMEKQQEAHSRYLQAVEATYASAGATFAAAAPSAFAVAGDEGLTSILPESSWPELVIQQNWRGLPPGWGFGGC
jgi:hypothetical protein